MNTHPNPVSNLDTIFDAVIREEIEEIFEAFRDRDEYAEVRALYQDRPVSSECPGSRMDRVPRARLGPDPIAPQTSDRIAELNEAFFRIGEQLFRECDATLAKRKLTERAAARA